MCSFDNIHHETLIQILEQKIKDRRFILLIHNALKCGYVEDWKYHRNYTGTPQGGIISPILSNILLNELDSYMEIYMKKFNKGKIRKGNKEYKKLRYQIQCCNKKIKENDEILKTFNWSGRNNQIEEIRRLKKMQRKIISIDPFDPNYKRMKYVRYADDFVIGIIGNKEEAKKIKDMVKSYLKTIKLELSEEKTLITHLKSKILFLGYYFRRWDRLKVTKVKYKNFSKPLTKRTLSGAIKLEIPKNKMVQYAKEHKYGNLFTLESSHRKKLIHNSELEILYIYNSELRGFANFYKLANNYHHLDHLFHIAQYSFCKTLASKKSKRLGNPIYKSLA